MTVALRTIQIKTYDEVWSSASSCRGNSENSAVEQDYSTGVREFEF